MAKYLVEMINAGKTEQRTTVEASTPMLAAVQIAGKVTFRHDEKIWMRVTPVGGQRSYQFVKD